MAPLEPMGEGVPTPTVTSTAIGVEAERERLDSRIFWVVSGCVVLGMGLLRLWVGRVERRG